MKRRELCHKTDACHKVVLAMSSNLMYVSNQNARRGHGRYTEFLIIGQQPATMTSKDGSLAESVTGRSWSMKGLGGLHLMALEHSRPLTIRSDALLCASGQSGLWTVNLICSVEALLEDCIGHLLRVQPRRVIFNVEAYHAA